MSFHAQISSGEIRLRERPRCPILRTYTRPFIEHHGGIVLIRPFFIVGLPVLITCIGFDLVNQSAATSTIVDRGYCHADAWSDPQQVTTLPAGVVLRSSTLVPGEHEMFTLIGTDLYWYLDEPFTESALRLFTSVGSLRRATNSNAFHAAPKAVAAQDGGIHLVWGESTQNAYPLPRHRFPLLPVDQLWYSYVSPDGSWSPSRLLLRAPHALDWFSHSRSIAVDADGVLHLVVASLGTEPSTIHYVRWSSDQPDTYQYDMPISPIALHSTIGVGPSGKIAMAFVGAAPTQVRPRSNQLFVAEFDSQADKWHKPMAIADPAIGYMSRLRLLGGRDFLDLIWLQGNAPDRRNDELRHVRLRSLPTAEMRDLEVSAAPIGEAVEDFSAIRDDCDRIHVAWVGNLSKPAMRTAIFDADGWSVSTNLFPQFNVTSLAIANDFRGLPVLTFFARDTAISATAREPFYRLYRSLFEF